ncbi:MAG: DNA gyrase C-terminal beta-propeller domain-containing protein, partial [Pseudomonadota bacterium]
WQLPSGGRNARGKPIVNILPIAPGTGIASVMPVNKPEEEWESLQIVFATSAGGVRRNALSDFTNVKRNGKIAMRLPDDVKLVRAQICDETSDVFLVTALGKAIRFPVTEVRVFKGRESTGVRGIRLAKGDRVVSMAVLRHFEASPEERAAFIRWKRATAQAEMPEAEEEAEEEPVADVNLSPERVTEMSAAEELILTITERGQGKLSSSMDYPTRGRGGQGVAAIDRGLRGGPIVAAFPVDLDDQIMLATDRGQSIRTPVAGISLRSRSAGGVKVLNVAPDETVVSVAWIAEPEDAEGPEEGGEG